MNEILKVNAHFLYPSFNLHFSLIVKWQLSLELWIYPILTLLIIQTGQILEYLIGVLFFRLDCLKTIAQLLPI